MPIKYCTQAARQSLRISSPLDPCPPPARCCSRKAAACHCPARVGTRAAGAMSPPYRASRRKRGRSVRPDFTVGHVARRRRAAAATADGTPEAAGASLPHHGPHRPPRRLTPACRAGADGVVADLGARRARCAADAAVVGRSDGGGGWWRRGRRAARGAVRRCWWQPPAPRSATRLAAAARR